jgi:hypothetical protein
MTEQVQTILTFVVVAGAAVYTIYALRSLFIRRKDDGCTSHGCPSCGIKNDIKKSYNKKLEADKLKYNKGNHCH